MKIFLDTSSLIKLYHEEPGTSYLDKLFDSYTLTKIFLSEIAKIEFTSAVWKKVRTKEITQDEANAIVGSFIIDYPNYIFVKLDNDLLINSRNLIVKYGLQGLRTLDSIQLASVLTIKSDLSFAITSDELLKSFIESEGIITK